MPTGQSIISGALTELGLLEQAGIPSVSDSNDALAELNTLWEGWGVDEGLIFAVQSQFFSLAANTNPNTIGPGGVFNTPYLPSRLYKAVQKVVAGPTWMRRELDIKNQEVYYAHGDLLASAVFADEIFVDWNTSPTTGLFNVYLFPVPSCPSTTQLELETGATFAAWSLVGSYILPLGYTEAIQHALAWHLLPSYGMAVAQQVAEVVRELGRESEQRIRTMNVINRQINPQMAGIVPAGAPAGSPISAPMQGQFQGLQPGR